MIVAGRQATNLPHERRTVARDGQCSEQVLLLRPDCSPRLPESAPGLVLALEPGPELALALVRVPELELGLLPELGLGLELEPPEPLEPEPAWLVLGTVEHSPEPSDSRAVVVDGRC